MAELEERLARVSGGSATVEEKVALYEQLVKKMDGDYKKLLTPAIAKAKAIEQKAEQEYAQRIDQARYTAGGVYEEAADRIADAVNCAVNDSMDRIYEMLDAYLESRTVGGRIKGFFGDCVETVESTGAKVKKAIAGDCAKGKKRRARK